MDAQWTEKSLRGALWGIFVGDAVAMPVHWFYDRPTLDKEYPELKHYNKETGENLYLAPKDIHAESMIGGMTYKGSVDILHDKAHYYNHEGSGEKTQDTHGNQLPDPPDKRAHYHQGLPAGKNTMENQVVRVFLRSVVKHNGYDRKQYAQDFVDFMTTPPLEDPYLSVWIRRYFENYSESKDMLHSAARQKDIWSIGHHGGWNIAMANLLLGMVDTLKGSMSEKEAVDRALQHSHVTHLSENVDHATSVTAPYLVKVMKKPLKGKELEEAIAELSSHIHRAKVRGDELLQKYRDAKGPFNIPKDEMYRLHTELQDEPFDPQALLDKPDREVLGEIICHACYTEHGLPATAYFLTKYANKGAFMDAIISNALCGGDSTQRGAIMGLMLGATLGVDAIPEHAIKGLADYKDIAAEIDAFVSFAMSQ